MSREIIDFIEDIVEAIEDIEAFAKGLTFTATSPPCTSDGPGDRWPLAGP